MNLKKWILVVSSLICLLFNPWQAVFAKTALLADYVVVGVGTAGAVLARRLTDDHVTSVIALQNGTNVTENPLNKFTEFSPISVVLGLFGPPLYFTSYTVQQPYANNRILPWTMAVPAGGATSVNAGAWCRGTNQVYSQWEMVDGPLWSVSRITALYKELEQYHGQSTNPFTRGYAGPINIRQIQNPSPLSLKYTQAIVNATGFPFVLDYNDPNTPIGASSQLQYTQTGPNGNLRVSSVTAFLDETVMTLEGHGVNGRRLRVLFNSPALKIIWQGNKAIGVEYLHHGQIRQVYANKGVIVTAGVNSSAFLLHSGVGPAAYLRSLKIPVIYDNPNVGQGLLDQPQLIFLFATDPLDTPITPNDPTLLFLDRRLPLDEKLTAFPVGRLFVNSIQRPPVNALMTSEQPGIFSQIAWLPDPMGNQTVRELRIATASPLPGIALTLFDLVQPRSKGWITINSNFPLSPAILNLGVFSDPRDLIIYRNGIKIYMQNIIAALQAIDPLYELLYPDPAILNDDNAITEFIKNNVASNMSFEGSNRMAPLSQGGVVDSTGRVYGVQNLFVADDSIVPVGMDGSSMASAYLIAANISHILQNQPVV